MNECRALYVNSQMLIVIATLILTLFGFISMGAGVWLLLVATFNEGVKQTSLLHEVPTESAIAVTVGIAFLITAAVLLVIELKKIKESS